MTVCRYWSKGSCHYGDKCQFEHPGAASRGYSAMGFGGATQQSPTQQTTQSPQELINTLVTTVKRDVETSEHGKQWQFSSYSPAKDCPCIPGIDDISPEEMRFEAYDAKSNPAAVTQYQQKCQQLSNSYLEKRRSLLNPTMEMKETLYKIYKKEPLNATSNSASSLFGQQQNSNIFGSPATSTNQPTKSLFGGSNLSTGTTSSSSIFGGKPSFGAPANLFGSQPTSTSAFSPTSSIFGGNNQAQQSTGIFGSNSTSGNSLFSPPTSQTTSSGLIQPSIFSSSTQSQQSQPATSLFGSPVTATSTTASSAGMFGGMTASSPFGGSATTTPSSSVFGQPAQFSGPVQGTTGGLFGQSAQSTIASGSVFGQTTTPTSQNTNIFGAPSQPSVSTAISSAGTSNLFGQPAVPSSAPFTSSSMFGQQSTFGQPVSSSMFGTPTTTTNTTQANNPFSAPINTSMPSTPIATQEHSASSLFSPQATGMSSLFGTVGGAPKSDTTSGLFGKPIEKQKDSSVYTPLSDLSEKEIEMFRTCNFMLGKIPENPPPVELC